ncbi:dihydrofolate reductase [bacterium]|nr:MAG: dihydrofolate reductase [bacterium]
MGNIISFVHISLDGFIAGPNGEMNWISINQEIFDHVEKRIGKTTTALYGKTTFGMMEAYWPTAADKPNASKHDKVHSEWYKGAHKVVLSSSMKGSEIPNTTIISENLIEEINALKQRTEGEILVFGSPRATHSLLQHNLIDGFWLFVNPVILGKGISLFSAVDKTLKLTLSPETRQFASGVTELNYVVDKS